jgi:hypothetical protein
MVTVVSPPKTRNITVIAPRHGAQRPGPELSSTIESLVRKEAQLKGAGKKKRKANPAHSASADSGNVPLVAVRSGYARRLTTQEGTDPLAAAIESASEWNSLLLTARAERGPQFDVATQQFHVEEGSDLYYDHTVLRDTYEPARPTASLPSTGGGGPNNDAAGGSISARLPSGAPSSSVHLMRPGPPPAGVPPHARFGAMPPMSAAPVSAPPGAFGGGGGAGAGAAPPGQFYPGPPQGMQPRPMHVDPAAGAMPFAGMHDRRMTRGMSQGMAGDGFGMGMYRS